tara:strand:- start:79 stop:303 length:225 start_codon:yes stop_codon:yes gene_type:complete
MIEIDGKRFPTVSDAAAALGVSARTVNEYVTKGIIPKPPTVTQGLRDVNVYPTEYMERAMECLKDFRARKRGSR